MTTEGWWKVLLVANAVSEVVGWTMLVGGAIAAAIVWWRGPRAGRRRRARETNETRLYVAQGCSCPTFDAPRALEVDDVGRVFCGVCMLYVGAMVVAGCAPSGPRGRAPAEGDPTPPRGAIVGDEPPAEGVLAEHREHREHREHTAGGDVPGGPALMADELGAPTLFARHRVEVRRLWREVYVAYVRSDRARHVDSLSIAAAKEADAAVRAYLERRDATEGGT